MDVLFISFFASNPYVNDPHDTEAVRRLKRVHLLHSALRCVKPGGRVVALNLSWAVDPTEKLMAEAGLQIEKQVVPATYWFSVFPSRLTVAIKPRSNTQYARSWPPPPWVVVFGWFEGVVASGV